MKRLFLTLVMVVGLLFPFVSEGNTTTSADDYPMGWVPEKSNRLVNDLCGVLTDQQVASLEQRLVAFDDSTSNQIMILITPSLGGDEIASFTQNVWRKWGIGSSEYNNGVVIVIKPKMSDDDYGELRIQTGRGLEGALPDLFCKDIIDDIMIPRLREKGDYYNALVDALDIIQPVCMGEYDYDRFKEDNEGSALGILLTIAIMFGVPIWAARRWAKKHPESFDYSTDNGWTPSTTYIPRSRDWGGFSGGGFSGGGSSGGGFGGFGGFGGGISGGGGASGRW